MCRSVFPVLIAILAMGCFQGSPQFDEIHRDAIVADMHSDTVLRMRDGFDFALRDTTGHLDLPRMKEGGVDLQLFACWLPTDTPREVCRAKVTELIDSLQAQVGRNRDRIDICRTAAEAESVIQSGRIAAVLGIENGVAIADTLENLQFYYDRGIRCMTLTHTASSDWCISSADTMPAFDGLTDFGRDVVKRMNELGMIIDLSHAHPRVVEEVLAISRDPVIASHSCVYDLCRHDRNLTDTQIRAIAANGGVIGINFYNGYLSPRWGETADSLWADRKAEVDSVKALYAEDPERRREEIGRIRKAVRRELFALVPVDVGTVVDHIDHVVGLVGAEHVGLGSDFDGIPSLPRGLDDCSQLPNLTRELLARGYERDGIERILGGNFLRVFRTVCDR